MQLWETSTRIHKGEVAHWQNMFTECQRACFGKFLFAPRNVPSWQLLLQEHEDKPEDCIPAEPGNEAARSFLAHAPTKGLWMPLGKEVKVMQCEYSHSNSAAISANCCFCKDLVNIVPKPPEHFAHLHIEHLNMPVFFPKDLSIIHRKSMKMSRKCPVSRCYRKKSWICPFIQIFTSVLIGSILGRGSILHQSFVEIR